MDAINGMLNEANKFHSNIKLVRQVGMSVSFLDVHIENKDDTLATSVYHKEAAEPYIVPFKSDHPRHIFHNIINGILMRAVVYSSTLQVFNGEQRSIKLMLLYNGYPPRYINSRFYKFFSSLLSTSIILPAITNENDYCSLRCILMARPTITEYEIANRLLQSDKIEPENEISNPLVQARLRKQAKFNENTIIHYTYENRLQNNKNDIHQIWKQLFQQTPVINTRLIIGNRNNRNLKRELVQHQPKL